ncbi:D-amino-acid transaminase [Staphylococcus devriesei]|uniref:D-alanine aminotransferase n=1 Tax=Staphylococcus devriesei TaxID=586733 RepID=A0A2T4KIA4_9STAP|nr:D-amino-acid transaminase [Staphylococcus devriesei]PTE73705.1 D-amino-acid transaminase [Staphylococcus devriesei]RIL74342.1 D-amino-acid transaminase [Staphylococcus devriesei]WKU13742.1 D-amino-acid transaminase [Staphylococcus devriesei]
MTKVFINGEFINQEDAKVSYEDRGYVFGDGIYEYIRAYDGKLFTVTEHFERFVRSAGELQIDLDYTVEELIDIVRQLLKVNEIKSGGVYIQATRGVAPREHSFPTPEVKPVLMAFAKSYDRPYEDLKNGINAVTVEDIRWLRCDIKSLNLLGNVLAKEYAVKYNASEAIQHRGETVTEGASSNVYAIKDGKIYTHPVSNCILNGITRKVIKWISEDYDLPFIEETFNVEFLKKADEIIISSTSAEVMPVVKLDGETVGDGNIGPVTRKLQEGFDKYIETKSN